MKTNFLILLSILFFSGYVYPQVGINTTNPEGVLHIDPLKNTSGTSNTLDDVIVSVNGWIGLGTVVPQARLHIKTAGTSSNYVSGFRLVDGNEGDGKNLVALNSNGLATWKTLTASDAITFGGAFCPDLSVSTPNYYQTNAFITLPKGRWVVMVIMYMPHNIAATNASCWVNTTFADNTTVVNTGQPLSQVVTPDIQGAQLMSAMAVLDSYSTGVLSGSVVINNTQPTQTYYYMAGGTVLYGGGDPSDVIARFGGYWSEDNIVAFRIPEDI